MARGKSKPSPVSGPGALSSRTDLSATAQPVRVPTGGAYGSGKALREQQQAAPVPQAGSPTVPTAGPAGGGGQPLPPPPADPFRPTERPDEPGTAGIPMGPGSSGQRLIAEDPDMLLQVFAERLSRAGFTGQANKIMRYMSRG